MLEYPSCFNSPSEWREWRALAERSWYTVTICEDCTAEYKAKMEAAGRCRPDEAEGRFSVNRRRQRTLTIA